MTLDYLDFDYSEDEEGTGTWDAMSSVKAERVTALANELALLLRWANQKFADRQGAAEDGFDWDYDLQAQDDGVSKVLVHFDTIGGDLFDGIAIHNTLRALGERCTGRIDGACFSAGDSQS